MKITKRSAIGIIGGTGKTGAQFAALFRKHGFTVRVTGSRTRSRNLDLLAWADIVIFALPLSHAADLMHAILASATKKNQLILDVSSLKSRETAAMLTAKGEVVGMHPLFGPTTDPKNERVVLCPARVSPETLWSLRTLLKSMMLKTTLMLPEDHDALMGTVQVVPHLKSLLMAEVLSARATDLKKVLGLCTPTYEMEFNVIARFLDDHPDLYMPIIFRNPETLSILEALRTIIDDYVRIAKTGDLKTAERKYRACQTFFRPHLKRARKHSEACIQTLLSLSR